MFGGFASKPFFKAFSVALLGLALLVAMQFDASANSRYAAFVYDANSGKVMFSRNADRYRFPASLTKMMTLYMVFDAIDTGKINLNTRMKVSRRAASMPPSKIHVRAGSTIRVRDAILALVTKSANDVSVVIAEHLAGSESEFARQMTRKARKIGMTRTTFKNASGLPNSRQRTTARDMARLGLSLRKKHPRSFRYFATRTFKYGRTTYRNHNRLLGSVKGVNGIKTGFIRASGFNLVTNVETRGRHLVAVVMGGRTGRSRDAHMRSLIERHIGKASRKKNWSTVPPLLVADNTPPIPVINPATKVNVVATTASGAAVPAPATNPVTVAANIVTDTELEQGSSAVKANGDATASDTPKLVIASVKPRTGTTVNPDIREGWKIQISATPNKDAAKELLLEAKQSANKVLSTKTPYTEPVVRGSQTLYRVRFAGFSDKQTARNACAYLKRKRYKCIAIN